jgi:hypothetical protein
VPSTLPPIVLGTRQRPLRKVTAQRRGGQCATNSTVSAGVMATTCGAERGYDAIRSLDVTAMIGSKCPRPSRASCKRPDSFAIRSPAEDHPRSRERLRSDPTAARRLICGALRVTERRHMLRCADKTSHGVVCLLSALRFHSLTTRSPSEVWLAIDRKARLPKADDLPLRIVRFSGEAGTAGIQEHRLDRTVIRCTMRPRRSLTVSSIAVRSASTSP